MDPIHRKTIRKCRVELVADIDPQSLWDGLETQGIFTPLMLEYMKAEKTRPDQVRMMLDYLQRRGPDAYEKFILVLRQAKHIHLVNKLRTAEAELRGTIPPPPEPSDIASETYSQLPPSERNIFYGQETGRGDAEMNELVLTEPMEESGMAGQVVQPQLLSMNQQQPSEAPGQAPSIASSGGTLPLDQQQSLGGAGQGPSQGPSQGNQTLNQPPPTAGVRQDPSMGLGQGPLGQGTSENMSYPVTCTDQQPGTSGSSMQTSSSLSSFQHVGYIGDPAEQYRMESFPRGYLLIINNKTFNNLTMREGTDKDCDMLKTLFLGKLGFRVSVLHDLTAREMKQKLKEFAQYPDLKNADSLVVAILSHGSENEMVYGVDGHALSDVGLVSLNDIFEPFNATNCQVMQGKPKLFIINACRGGAEDVGSLYSMPSHPVQPMQSDTSSIPPLESTMPDQFKRIPNLQDVLLAFSTIQGHVSWRHKTEGSWFINALVEVFGKYANQKHVVDMLVKVNNRVSSNMSSDNRVQLPGPQVMLTKDWYLNPPNL